MQTFVHCIGITFVAGMDAKQFSCCSNVTADESLSSSLWPACVTMDVCCKCSNGDSPWDMVAADVRQNTAETIVSRSAADMVFARVGQFEIFFVHRVATR